MILSGDLALVVVFARGCRAGEAGRGASPRECRCVVQPAQGGTQGIAPCGAVANDGVFEGDGVGRSWTVPAGVEWAGWRWARVGGNASCARDKAEQVINFIFSL